MSNLLEQNNIKLIQQNYTAFSQGDFETVFRNFSDHIVWESQYVPSISIHGIYHGKDRVVDFFKILGDTLIVQDYTPQKFLAEDDIVAVIGYEHVTVKLTNKSYKNDWVQIWTIQDQKVAKLQSFNNVANVLEAFNPN